MSPECRAGPPVGEVPEDARPVGADRSEGAAVGAERQVVDRPGVAPEDESDGPGCGVPGLDRVVVAAREDRLAVGGEDQPADLGGVSEQVFVRIAIFVRVTPCRLGKSGAENEEPLQLGQGCLADADEATRRADMRVPASASLPCKRLSPLHERPP